MARIELSNIGGGGGTTLSLTTAGTSGAATLAGSVLNIPIYQGQLTLTTTGTSGAATLSGDILNIPQYSGGGGGTPAGSTGEIQYNNAGVFAASANLAWDNSNVRLNVGAPSAPTGRVNIKGAGALTTTNFELTNSGNTSILKVLDNGTITGGSNLTYDGTNFSVGTASTTGFLNVTGAATTTKPLMNLQNTSSASGGLLYMSFSLRAGGLFTISENTSSASVSIPSFRFQSSGRDGIGGSVIGSIPVGNDVIDLTGAALILQGQTSSGTIANSNVIMFRNFSNIMMKFAANGNCRIGSPQAAPSARLHVDGSDSSSGTNAFLVQNSTSLSLLRIENDGKISYLATNTAAGTTGAQTINRPSGTVNFAAGATALVVTNSLCTTSSIVFATVRTNDATAYIKNVVPAAGSFTINLGAAATAETSVGFFIIN